MPMKRYNTMAVSFLLPFQALALHRACDSSAGILHFSLVNPLAITCARRGLIHTRSLNDLSLAGAHADIADLLHTARALDWYPDRLFANTGTFLLTVSSPTHSTLREVSKAH